MLLNENRNRVPQITSAPGNGNTPGKRGDIMMLKDPVSSFIYICIRSSISKTDSTNSLWGRI